VKVVIIPADASAEIEGEEAQVKAGMLEIAGTLGSVRRVRIFKGKGETTADIIITDVGPIPPKIELTFGGPKAAAKVASSTSSGGHSADPPTPEAPKSGINVEFE
jgi:serine/threonine-protein kinase